MRGKLSSKKVSPAPSSKNFAQGFVGEDIILPPGSVGKRRKQKIPRREDFFAAGGYSPVFSQKYLLLVYYHAFIVPSASIGFQLVTQTLPLL